MEDPILMERLDFQSRPTDAEKSTPNPRAFAIGTGAVFQTVGVLQMLAGCFVWALSAYFHQPSPDPAAQWYDFLDTRFGAAMVTLGLLAGTLHGLILAAVGSGLQGERPGSGRLSVAANVVALALYLIIAGALAMRASWWSVLVPGAMCLWTAVLLILALTSADVLRRSPPPPDVNRATPEIMEEHRRRREERLRNFD